MSRPIPKRFNVVGEDGREAAALPCPFCRRQLTIGFIDRSEAEADGRMVVVHEAPTGSGPVGCEPYDNLDGLAFLQLVIPALERASKRRGHA